MMSIDEDLFDKLKGINASQLVNEMLRRHFDNLSEDNKYSEMSIEELKVLAKKEEREKELLKELEDLNGSD